MSPIDSDMVTFAEDVLRTVSFFTQSKDVTFVRSKRDISPTGHEEDIVVTPCGLGEKVCI